MLTVEYDRPYKGMKQRALYRKEYELLRDFVHSEHENMSFEYASAKDLENTRQALMRHIEYHRLPIELHRRGLWLYVCRVR